MVIMAGSTQIGQCILREFGQFAHCSSHGSITTMDCAQSGMQCNFNYLQCLGRVGPEF